MLIHQAQDELQRLRIQLGFMVVIRVIRSRRDAPGFALQTDQVANEAQADIKSCRQRPLRAFAAEICLTDFRPNVERVRLHCCPRVGRT